MASAHDRIMDMNPTPPAHHEQHAHRRHRIGLLVLVGGLGFFAGIIGGILAAAIIVPLPSIVTTGSSFASGMGWRGTPVAPTSAVASAAVVDVFIVAPSADLPAMLPLDERSGRGIVVSNDGWVATAKRALPSPMRVRTEQRSIIVVGPDRRIRAVDRIALDPVSDLAFIHVIDLDGTVLQLRTLSDVRANDALFAPSGSGGVREFAFSGLLPSGSDAARVSSDRWATLIAPWPALDVVAGTPFLDASGALVGIAVEDGPRVLPASVIAGALPSLFARSVVERNVLGLIYRDASEFGHEPTNPIDGIVIVANGIAPASPLRGKIAVGDRIIALGDDRLTAYRRLPDLLQEYPIGGRVTLRAIRRGSEKREEALEVQLGRVTGESLLVVAPSKSVRAP